MLTGTDRSLDSVCHSDGLRCHLCGGKIAVGEKYSYSFAVGSMHLDDVTCDEVRRLRKERKDAAKS